MEGRLVFLRQTLCDRRYLAIRTAKQEREPYVPLREQRSGSVSGMDTNRPFILCYNHFVIHKETSLCNWKSRLTEFPDTNSRRICECSYDYQNTLST